MSEPNEYTRRITVTFETEDPAHELFAYLSARWDDIKISGTQVVMTDWLNIVEDIWYAICEADVPDKVLSIQLQRVIGENSTS